MQSFIDSLHDAFRADDPSIENKSIEAEHFHRLQNLYRALASNDLDLFTSELAEEVELEIIGPAVVPFLGKWQGKSEVVKAIQRNFSLIEEQHPAVTSVTAQGNQIVVVGHEQGRYRTGADYALHWIQVFTYRDGKLARVRELISGAV